jgi:primosomal protein N'
MGSTNVREQLTASMKRHVVDAQGYEAGRGDIVVDTEVALHRVDDASTVCFLDLDSELESGRLDAMTSTLSSISRAARLVGSNGRIILQSRNPSHPVLMALLEGTLEKVLASELQMRHALHLPPYSVIVEATGEMHRLDDVQLPLGCSLARVSSDRAFLRFTDNDVMRSVLTDLKASVGRHVRMSVEPYRQ